MPTYENRDVVLKLSSMKTMAENKAPRAEQYEITLPGGTRVKVGAEQARRYGVQVSEPAPEPAPTATPEVTEDPAFDPSQNTVDQVLTYLVDADDAERERVLELERQGNARKGILGSE